MGYGMGYREVQGTLLLSSFSNRANLQSGKVITGRRYYTDNSQIKNYLHHLLCALFNLSQSKLFASEVLCEMIISHSRN